MIGRPPIQKKKKDGIAEVIAEAKQLKDRDTLALLNAVGDNKMPKVQYKTEYWVPALKFAWDLDGQGNIKGIYNEKGDPDPELIRKYIEDGKWKMLTMGIQAIKAINDIATKRQGNLLVDREKGFNLILSKSGEKRMTKYTAQKSDILPMPADFYTDEKMIDPFEVAQSLMYTDEYMDKVIGKYLYGEECPDVTDDCYAYPELREQLKAKISDETEEEEVKPAPRQRPGRGAPVAEKATPAPVAPAPVAPATPAPEAPVAPVAPVRSRPTRGAAPAARTGRPARNLADDIKDIN